MATATRNPGKVPALLLAIALFKAAWLAWLWTYGMPRSTADIVCFKQPAYMRLMSPNFSVPTYAGKAPYIDKFNSYPAVMYYYLNYAVFRVAGFSLYTSLAFDLVVHVVLTTLAAWCIWKLTGRQLPATVFLLASSQLLFPLGRPEELGILLVLVGLLAVERGALGMAGAIVALGMAGATAPGAAIVGTVLIVAYDGFRREFDPSFRRRAVTLCLLSPLVSLAIYAWYTWPYLSEAWEQHRALDTADVYYAESVLAIILRHPAWALFTLPLLIAAFVVGCYCLWRRPDWYPRATPAGAFVGAATIAIGAGCLLNIVALRLEYDFRHVTILSLALLTTAICWLPAPAGARYPARAWAAMAAVLVCSFVASSYVVRFSLAAFSWDHAAVTYDQSARVVREIVPSKATVGGDGYLWTIIDDGRPYLSIAAVAEKYWPEYLITGTWSDVPAIAQRPGIAEKFASQYVEITPLPLLPQNGYSVNLLGFDVPITSGRSDWYVRIWKRRTPPEPPAAADPPERAGAKDSG
ncbi:MAG: hypothetical protein AB7O59_00875 [Pirellulales bacterium]